MWWVVSVVMANRPIYVCCCLSLPSCHICMCIYGRNSTTHGFRLLTNIGNVRCNVCSCMELFTKLLLNKDTPALDLIIV